MKWFEDKVLQFNNYIDYLYSLGGCASLSSFLVAFLALVSAGVAGATFGLIFLVKNFLTFALIFSATGVFFLARCTYLKVKKDKDSSQ